ncbi:HTH-type transcriptional repressor ComR [Acidithrix ferrooxidans]|uniref:HTH-type transcriptional repressor ComR n=2 Tax=Acidimicrobiaceae TaxID=84994 RepID=A0A0D8HCN4_9ACTN|nr:HTH-type transcriptional repressor ComR [Acidithrix ferrooxidans]
MVYIKTMARKREFDNEQVLLGATQVFAQFGYSGTSIDQLVEGTGLLRGSIYQAFASKAGLFRACLSEQVHSLCSDLLTDISLLEDLLIVAMWERARTDKEVAGLIVQALQVLAKCQQQSPAEMLFARLVLRADMPINQ